MIKEIDYEEVGERIYRVRADLGLSQKAFAEKLGCEQYKVSRLEKGLAVRDLDWLQYISVGFDVPLGWLIFGFALKEDKSMSKNRKSTVYLGASEEENAAFREAMNKAPWGLNVLDSEGQSGGFDYLHEEDGEITFFSKEEMDDALLYYISSIKDAIEPSAEARKMAEEILEFSSGEERGAFWREAEENLLAFLLLYVAMTEDDECDIHKLLTAVNDSYSQYEWYKGMREEMETNMPPELKRAYELIKNDRNTNAVAASIDRKILKVNLMWE